MIYQNNVNVGFPGSVHDARIFRRSAVFNEGVQGTLFEKVPFQVNGTVINPYLVGDQAYPLQPFLMKIYPDSNPPVEGSAEFNEALKLARILLEQSFADLKNKWSILGKKVTLNTSIVPQVVTACCVLHNVVKESQIFSMPKWIDVLSKRLQEKAEEDTPHDFGEEDRSATGIRNALAYYMRSENEM